MLILNNENQVVNTDKIDEEYWYSVLRFKDPKDIDFHFEHADAIEEFTSVTMKLQIGEHTLFVPFHWSILCSDFEYVQTIPLYEFNGYDHNAFCINPIDGYLAHYPTIRMLEVFPQPTTWSAPPMQDKDMLVVPIGELEKGKGPLCAILSPHKLDINKSIADII